MTYFLSLSFLSFKQSVTHRYCRWPNKAINFRRGFFLAVINPIYIKHYTKQFILHYSVYKLEFKGCIPGLFQQQKPGRITSILASFWRTLRWSLEETQQWNVCVWICVQSFAEGRGSSFREVSRCCYDLCLHSLLCMFKWEQWHGGIQNGDISQWQQRKKKKKWLNAVKKSFI